MTTKTIKITARRLVLAASLLAVLFIHPAQATLGGLDGSFGTGGKVTTKIGNVNDYGYDLVRQPDGKLVVAGQSVSGVTLGDFALARYNPNGSLDTGFSGDGKQTTDFGGNGDQASGVALQANGRIVAAGIGLGTDLTSDFALARYLGG